MRAVRAPGVYTAVDRREGKPDLRDLPRTLQQLLRRSANAATAAGPHPPEHPTAGDATRPGGSAAPFCAASAYLQPSQLQRSEYSPEVARCCVALKPLKGMRDS